ncbi:uncharacterized protein LOC143918882 [Arctopsyche grandis]|uniref:uncharacterized protein LOC143918882 n=1 Tax=Arctopsyche grandis TaxID=121162 RepID=UPI00406D992B
MAASQGRLSTGGIIEAGGDSSSRNDTSHSSPIITPKKSQPSYLNLSGQAKSGYRIARDFALNIEKWFGAHENGTYFCQALSRQYGRCELERYPVELKNLSSKFESIMSNITLALSSVEAISVQYSALAKLMPCDDPLFNTWSITKLSREMDKIYKMLKEETNVKRVIRENVFHCRDEDLLEVYVSAWEFNTQIKSSTINLFLIELDFDRNK